MDHEEQNVANRIVQFLFRAGGLPFTARKTPRGDGTDGVLYVREFRPEPGKAEVRFYPAGAGEVGDYEVEIIVRRKP